MGGLQIEDGTGSGRSATVDVENRFHVDAISASPEHHTNHKHGKAFSINFEATPTGTGDCFFYMKNTSEEDIIIEGFGLYMVANDYVDIKLNDYGTPISGNDITPANCNGGSGNIASGTFQNGNDITGLSGGTTVYRYYHASSNGTTYHNFEMDIIVPKNGTFTFYIGTGTTALHGFLNLIYHNHV